MTLGEASVGSGRRHRWQASRISKTAKLDVTGLGNGRVILAFLAGRPDSRPRFGVGAPSLGAPYSRSMARCRFARTQSRPISLALSFFEASGQHLACLARWYAKIRAPARCNGLSGLSTILAVRHPLIVMRSPGSLFWNLATQRGLLSRRLLTYLSHS